MSLLLETPDGWTTRSEFLEEGSAPQVEHLGRGGSAYGDFSTLNISESPSVVGECSLSDVLEPSVPERFSLSPRACAGILRRARSRGKKLPDALDALLRAAAEPGWEEMSDEEAAEILRDEQLELGEDPEAETSLDPSPPATRPEGSGRTSTAAEPGSQTPDPSPLPSPSPPDSQGEPGTPAETMPPSPSAPPDSQAIGFHVHEPMDSPRDDGRAPALMKSAAPATTQGTGLRRLTPTECERLMGWPDGWTWLP